MQDGATAALLQVMVTAVIIVAAAGEGPHVVKSPDQGIIEMGQGAGGNKVRLAPVQVNDVGLKLVNGAVDGLAEPVGRIGAAEPVGLEADWELVDVMAELGLDFAEPLVGGMGAGAVALFLADEEVAVTALGEKRLVQPPGGDGRAEPQIKRAELKDPHPGWVWLGVVGGGYGGGYGNWGMPTMVPNGVGGALLKVKNSTRSCASKLCREMLYKTLFYKSG